MPAGYAGWKRASTSGQCRLVQLGRHTHSFCPLSALPVVHGCTASCSLRSGSGFWRQLSVLHFLWSPTASLLTVHVDRHDPAAAAAHGEARASAQGKWQADLLGEERCWGWAQLTLSLFFNPSVDFLSGLIWSCLKVNLAWLCFIVVLTELYVALKNNKKQTKKKPKGKRNKFYTVMDFYLFFFFF